MIYTWILSVQTDETDFQPAIYSLRDLFKPDFDPDIKWDKHDFSFPDLKEDFENGLIYPHVNNILQVSVNVAEKVAEQIFNSFLNLLNIHCAQIEIFVLFNSCYNYIVCIP